MLLPVMVDLYCIGFQWLQTCYIFTVEGWQHVIFSHNRSLLGVDHLIVFETNQTILVTIPDPLPVLPSLIAASAFFHPLLAARLHLGRLATYGIAIGLRKKRRKDRGLNLRPLAPCR